MTLLSSRLELDLATMVFCRRFILNSQSQWYIHLRADSFPQGGRDYFISEYDYVCEQHVSRLLESGNMTLTTRILPLSIHWEQDSVNYPQGQSFSEQFPVDFP